MNYIKVRDGLFIVEQEIVKKNTKVVNKPKNVNHIFIYDRSGSMYGLLGTLAKDLKQRLRTVQTGDTITLGWFSSPGEYRFPLKGLKISGDEDFKALDKVVDANSTTLGSTCFSEILADAKDVVKDLSPLGNTFALTFLTDGYPTVWPYEKEVKAIHKAIDDIKGEVAASLLVGYGNYYNKELMADMAERFGGSLIHSSDLKTFPVAFQQFMEKSRNTEPRMEVELAARPSRDGVVFNVSGGDINVYQVENGMISFAPTRNATDYLYVITDKAPKGGDEITVNPKIVADTTEERLVKAAYAAAYTLVQRTKSDVAIDVLGKLGDVALIDRVNNAFTNTEYGAAEQGILDAVGKPQLRGLNGFKKNYVPKPDAFCVLDAMELLMQDEKAEFWPEHEEFDYKRIGPPQKTDDKYPKFQPNKDSRCQMSKLVWHGEKLNLSVLANIKGHIDLTKFKTEDGKTYKGVGLEKTFETSVFRTYTVIKDGFLNVDKLPVSMSKQTYQKFLDEGIIDPEHNRHYEGRAYVLHLDRLPVMNRATAEGKTSAKRLAELALLENKLCAQQKVLNWMREQIEPKVDRGLGLQVTPAQEDFLKEVGVTKGGYRPPSEKGETTDFYMAKEFELKIKGCSSLPKVDDVIKKIGEKKNLTLSQQLIADGLAYAKSAEKLTNSTKKLAEIDRLLEETKTQINIVRPKIQRTKFAVILGKKWFDEFTSREENTLTVDGCEVTFSLREVRVDF